MCKAWQDMDQITIAAIEGHCIGGGAALVVSLGLGAPAAARRISAFPEIVSWAEHEPGLDPADAGAGWARRAPSRR